jgi:hypothetical protein
VRAAYEARGGEYISMPAGTASFNEVYEGENKYGEPVHPEHTRPLDPGEVIDLTRDSPPNYHYFGMDHPQDSGPMEF